ncbi:MAG: hypothetical protein WD184_00625 [Acidimicrobiia bacterium]
MRRFNTIFAVAVLLLTVMSPVHAGNDTLWVDDDGGQCKSADHTTIQDAIDAAVAGATIRVCAGTYAGATVDKMVNLEAVGHVVIDTGPYSHPGFLVAGFLFPPDYSGSGSSIRGFHFQGTQQTGGDDGELDFPIFSRGANGVAVSHNTMNDSLQGITNWNGSDWVIDHNTLTDLWTFCGGGIGILAGGFDGGAHGDNEISHNEVSGTLHVSSGDCGGYDGTGIVLFADFRSGRAGATSLSGNTIHHNTVELVSDTPGVVNVNGFELTDTRDTVPVITGNNLSHNQVPSIGDDGFTVSGAPGNFFGFNKIGVSGGFDISDDTLGAGTGGTANTWDKNRCDTSSPGGLCK